MRAVGYLRVSSKGQRDRQTIDAQRLAVPAFVARQGWQLVRPVEHYVDDGRTAKAGRLDEREAFQRLLRDAAAGAFDAVVVVDLDRLTRSEDLTERGAVLGAFQRAGVKIAIATSGQVLDLSSSLGDLFSGLQAFFAAEENRKRRERTVAGKAVAIARGRKPAGPTPYGLRYDRTLTDNPWSIDPAEAELVREMFRRVAAGESCEAVAIDFNARGIPRARGGEWIRERVWQIVTARTYVGEWTADKRRGAVLRVPAIVDLELWERTQAQLAAQGRRGLRRTRHVYLLEDLAVCERCGARIGICSASGIAARRHVASQARYVCAHRRRPPYGSERCPLAYQRTADVDERLWAAVVDVLRRDDLLGEALGRERRHVDDRARWEDDLAEHRRRLDRLVAAEAAALARHRRGQVSAAALDVELAAVARERALLERQVVTAERAVGAAALASARASDVRDAVTQARAQIDAATPAARQHLIRALFEPGSIVVGEPTITATLRLRLDGCAVDGSVRRRSTSFSHVTSVEFRLVA